MFSGDISDITAKRQSYLLLEEIGRAKRIVVQVKDEKLPANKNVILWGKVNRMLSISHKDR